MRILATFPGRAGDLLWALPTVRAISEHFGVPVDLQIAGEFASMVPLLAPQPYLGQVLPDAQWHLSGDWQPPTILLGYDRTFHLGYRRWPELSLPYETAHALVTQWREDDGACPLELSGLALVERPWITVAGPGAPCDIAVGFTEAWFELKLGLLCCVGEAMGPWLRQLTPPGSRWTQEVPPGTVSVRACGWLDAARTIRNSKLFFGDCSALHVLAVALGKPVVLMEPMEARHNPIFYPLGETGRVRLVTGNDGLPTFDARHCTEALKEALAHGQA